MCVSLTDARDSLALLHAVGGREDETPIAGNLAEVSRFAVATHTLSSVSSFPLQVSSIWEHSLEFDTPQDTSRSSDSLRELAWNFQRIFQRIFQRTRPVTPESAAGSGRTPATAAPKRSQLQRTETTSPHTTKRQRGHLSLKLARAFVFFNQQKKTPLRAFVPRPEKFTNNVCVGTTLSLSLSLSSSSC